MGKNDQECFSQTLLAELTGFVTNAGSVLSADQKANLANKLLQGCAFDAAALSKFNVGDAIRHN